MTASAPTPPETAPEKKPRHPMVAFAAGVACPGLGLLLTGRFLLAAFVVALWFMMYLVTPILVIDHAPELLPKLPKIVLASNAAIWLGGAILAAGLAFKDGPRVRKGYEHLWWVAGFFLVVFVGFSQLRARLLEPQMVLRPLYDTSLLPHVKEGTILVVQKRGVDVDRVAVNDVIAVKDAGRALSEDVFDYGYARVIATAGAVVEVKEEGSVVVDGFPVITTPCAATVISSGHSCFHEKQATTAGTAERDTVATSLSRSFPPTSVGPGQVFVLPDDRGRKLRAPAGLIATNAIAGRVVVTDR